MSLCLCVFVSVTASIYSLFGHYIYLSRLSCLPDSISVSGSVFVITSQLRLHHCHRHRHDLCLRLTIFHPSSLSSVSITQRCSNSARVQPVGRSLSRLTLGPAADDKRCHRPAPRSASPPTGQANTETEARRDGSGDTSQTAIPEGTEKRRNGPDDLRRNIAKTRSSIGTFVEMKWQGDFIKRQHQNDQPKTRWQASGMLAGNMIRRRERRSCLRRKYNQ